MAYLPSRLGYVIGVQLGGQLDFCDTELVEDLYAAQVAIDA